MSFSKDHHLQKIATDALSGHFCFLKETESGKIPEVHYLKNEKLEVVNIKRSIVSAFQANFKHTTIEYETDAQSHHQSHYEYALLRIIHEISCLF